MVLLNLPKHFAIGTTEYVLGGDFYIAPLLKISHGFTLKLSYQGCKRGPRR